VQSEADPAELLYLPALHAIHPCGSILQSAVKPEETMLISDVKTTRRYPEDDKYFALEALTWSELPESRAISSNEEHSASKHLLIVTSSYRGSVSNEVTTRLIDGTPASDAAAMIQLQFM
jgi:hypothetical protein